jgi:hypothetical protein
MQGAQLATAAALTASIRAPLKRRYLLWIMMSIRGCTNFVPKFLFIFKKWYKCMLTLTFKILFEAVRRFLGGGM